jgi:aspartate aminotransferase
MTGWRIGWVMGPRVLTEACAALVSHSTQCPTSFAQVGAIAALEGPQGFIKKLRSEYRRRRDFLARAVAAIPGVRCLPPEGAFYLFPDVSKHVGSGTRTTLDLAERLLEEAKVAVVPGEGFGAPGYLRLSFARPMAELEEAARRLSRFFGVRDAGMRAS